MPTNIIKHTKNDKKTNNITALISAQSLPDKLLAQPSNPYLKQYSNLPTSIFDPYSSKDISEQLKHI